MRILLLLLATFTCFANQTKPMSETDASIKQALQVLNIAKKESLKSFDMVKKEFGIEDQKEPTLDIEKEEQPRDIFYTQPESQMINKAYSYLLQGKTFNFKIETPITKDKTTKSVVIMPMLQLSSIIFENASSWTVFTNLGKLNYTKPQNDKLKITGISTTKVEFVLFLNNETRKNMKNFMQSIQNSGRMEIVNQNLTITLYTGECVFEEDFTITKNCKGRKKDIIE